MNLFNDNELDRWLRQSAGHGNEPPASDGWDTPAERVWEQVRTGLDDRKKRRRRYFAFWSVLLIGLFAGGWWAGNAAFSPNASTPFGTGQAPVHDVRQTGRNNAAPEQSKTTSDPSSTNSILKHNSGPVAGEMAYVEPAPNPDNTPGKPAVRVEREVKHFQSDDLESLDQRPAWSAKSNIVNATSGQTTGSRQTAGDTRLTTPSRLTSKAERVKLTTLDARPSDRSETAVPDDWSDDLKWPDQKPAQSDDSKSSDRSETAVPIDWSDESKSPGQKPARSDDSKSFDLNETTVLVDWSDDSKSSDQMSARSDDSKPSDPPPAPVINPHKHRPRLYAGAATGLFFTTRILKPTGTTLPNGRETGAWTWQQGLHIGLEIHPNWAIETGLQRTTIRLQAERLLRFRYRVNNEKFDKQRFLYQNSANDVMETAFGAVEMRMDIGREPNRPIDDLAVFRIMLHTDEQVHYWRIPLLFRFRSATTGPWQWSLAAGPGFNFAAGYDLQLTAARTNRPGVRDIRARVLGRASGLAPFMADVQFSGQVGYRISPRCSLLLTPEFRYGLSSMYRQGSFRSQAVSGGVHVGVMVRL